MCIAKSISQPVRSLLKLTNQRPLISPQSPTRVTSQGRGHRGQWLFVPRLVSRDLCSQLHPPSPPAPLASRLQSRESFRFLDSVKIPSSRLNTTLNFNHLDLQTKHNTIQNMQRLTFFYIKTQFFSIWNTIIFSVTRQMRSGSGWKYKVT